MGLKIVFCKVLSLLYTGLEHWELKKEEGFLGVNTVQCCGRQGGGLQT